jgi:dGTPase
VSASAPDGFEGNAQSFRIVTTIDLHGPSGTGLDLTAAVRAAVLKYPWARHGYPDPHPSAAVLHPRGGGPLPGAPDAGSAKFSAYSTELDDLVDCRAAFPVGPWQQTVEAAVMDTADDIAYAIHDLEDFTASALQQAGVAAEERVGPNTPGTPGRAPTLSGNGGACVKDPGLRRRRSPRRGPGPPTWSTACSPCRSTGRWRGAGGAEFSARWTSASWRA